VRDRVVLGIDGERARGSRPSARSAPAPRMRARAARRPREALELLNEHLAEQPDAYEAALAAHEIARELGRDADVAAAALRVIRIELRRGLTAAALDHWLDLVRGGIPERVESSLLIPIALLLREHDHRTEAVRALRFALESSDERENHVIAMRIARAARGLDPGTTETAAWRALASVDLSLEDRQALENLIAEGLTTPAERAASYQRTADRNAPGAPAAPLARPEPQPEPAHPARPAANRDRDARCARARRRARGAARARRGRIEIQTHQGQKKARALRAHRGAVGGGGCRTSPPNP
jgi:hypothetical protein